MSRFRKLPVEIDAMQFDGSWSSAREIMRAFDTDESVGWCSEPAPGSMTIETLEGTMWASPGDWIIRGVRSELYPCKPDVFATIYEVVA